MRQNSREIVKAAVHFQGPERLPVQMASLGVADNAFLWHPMHRSGRGGAGVAFRPVAPQADAWGCVWAQTSVHNMGQVLGHPFSEGIPEDLESTAHPEYSQDVYYEGLEGAIAQAEGQDKYIQVGLFMVLFERVHCLMGFEQAMVSLADPDLQPDILRLIEFIVEKHLVYIDNLDRRFPGRIHAVCMTDDFGTQHSGYVSGAFWKTFFLPHYKRLFDRMHAAGYDVWVHSCGKVNDIVEGYREAGANVVNLQQPRALGIEEMGSRYRGRIAFESLCDIQSTLPTGDALRIHADAEALLTHWATPEGGFIFSDYGDGAAIGAPLEAKRTMYQAFAKASRRLYPQPMPDLP